MTTQSLSDVLAVTGYGVSILWLVRIFLWKRYVQKAYWEKKPELSVSKLQELARQKGRKLPKFSILIPAKEEASVIGKTLEHFTGLQYPKELYEVIVVTDEKEIIKHNGNGNKTTQAVVEEKQKTLLPHFKNIKHVCCPPDFDGRYRGARVGTEVKSTKGRALNYGLQHVSSDTDIIGIYDADTRPDGETLLHAAHEISLNGNKIKIMQGPKLQTSNFSRLNPFCKLYSLIQSMVHEWYVPAVYMKKLPFVGGSHCFMHRNIVEKLEGFDHESFLLEDAIFAVRAYLEEDEWSYFLPCLSVEQTPATFKGFFKQRLRWALGQFEIIRLLWRNYRKHSSKKALKAMFHVIMEGPVKNIGLWLFMLLWLLHSLLVRMGVAGVSELSHKMHSKGLFHLELFGQYLFLYWLYARYFQHSDLVGQKKDYKTWFTNVSFLVLAIPAYFVGILPYLTAFLLYVLGKEIPWMKTEKTIEEGGAYENQ